HLLKFILFMLHRVSKNSISKNSIAAILVSAIVIAGCVGNTRPQPVPAQAPIQPPRDQAQAEPAESPPEVPVLSPQAAATAALEATALARAEGAFRAGRLTEPAHDNAYESFHSVLLLNPNSSQARAGVQAI